MLRANIDYERGFWGGLTITVQGPNGSRTFYGEESRDEAWNYYQNEKRLEDEIALREKQSNLADMQMREIKERERREQEERFRQKNTPPQFGLGGIPHRPPTPQPYYDPEYAEFQKWKKENDPEYIKFKQEKAKAKQEAERNELSEKTAKIAKEGKELKIREEKEIIELLKGGETGKRVIENESSKLYFAHRYEEAIIYFNQLLKFYPNECCYIESKASSLQYLKRHEESIVCYDLLIKLNPKNAEVYLNAKNSMLN